MSVPSLQGNLANPYRAIRRLFMMGDFLYLASNPSMPGLLKVGRTCTSPSERMAALHTTGVATPFELEFVAQFDDAVSAENKAHRALASFRVARNREFFRIDAIEAVRRILPSVGPCEIDWANTKRQLKVAELEREYAEHQLREREERQRKVAALREDERHLLETLSTFHKRRAELEREFERLGPEPAPRVPALLYFLSFAYLPAPLGWMVWIGALQVFDEKRFDLGFTCAVLIAVGWVAHKWIGNGEARHAALTRPWEDLKAEINRLEHDAKPVETELERLRRVLSRRN